MPSKASISTVMLDWDEGLYMQQSNTRVAPLRILEHPKLRNLWKFGDVVHKHVGFWKVVVYAVHRRVAGLSRHNGDNVVHQGMSLEAAVEQVQQILDRHTSSMGDNGRSKAVNKPGLSKLVTSLLPGSKWTPSKYEEKFLEGRDSIFLLPSRCWHTVDWVA
jgi:hypothetical protein